MRRTRISATLAVAWLLTGCHLTATRAGVSDAGRAEEQIRQLHAQEVRAFLARDVRALRDLWADDFVVTNPLNQVVDKAQVLGMVELGVLAFTSFTRQIERVRVYEDVAIAIGEETVVWAGRMPMAGQTSRVRITVVWMHRGGRWLQVARHANIVPPAGR